MKTLVSALFALTILFTPAVSSAYFMSDFTQKLNTLPDEWPEWIDHPALHGRTPTDRYLEYMKLQEEEKEIIRNTEDTSDWPDWIGRL